MSRRSVDLDGPGRREVIDIRVRWTMAGRSRREQSELCIPNVNHLQTCCQAADDDISVVVQNNG